jgi:hypothetical protein
MDTQNIRSQEVNHIFSTGYSVELLSLLKKNRNPAFHHATNYKQIEASH